MRIIQSANPRPLNLLAVGPNGLVAASSSIFGAMSEVDVWDVGSGRLVFAPAPPDIPRGLVFHPDGLQLIVALWRALWVMDVATGAGHTRPISTGSRPTVAFTARGPRFVTCGTRHVNGIAITCQALDGEWNAPAIWSIREDVNRIYELVVSADGARVATAERLERAGGRVQCEVVVRDGDTGARLFVIPLDPASPVRQLAFSADGATLLVRTDSNAVQLFDAATGTDAGALKHKGRPFVTGVAVHPRGPVACARTDGTVTLWDVRAREQLRVLDWKAGRLASVAVAPDGALAAAGTEDGKVIVWDVDE